MAKTRLRAFWRAHPGAQGPLSTWHSVVSHACWTCFGDVKQTYRSADQVKDFVVFDVGRYRLVADIAYLTRSVYIKHVFTHADYDDWTTALRRQR